MRPKLPIIAVTILLFAVMPVKARGAADNFEYRSQVFLMAEKYDVRTDTLLNPESLLFSTSSRLNKLGGNFSFAYLYDDSLKLKIKVRPVWLATDESTSFSTDWDEAYLDYKLAPTVFLTAGLVNMYEGVGLAYNPTDFFAAGKTIDYGETEEERRENRTGDYMIKFLSLMNDASFTLAVAPRITGYQDQSVRYFVKYYTQFGDTDLGLSYFQQQERHKMGINISSVIGASTEFHSEIAVNQGSDRGFLTNQYKVEIPNPTDQYFIRAIVGGHYTFPNRSNLSVEYFYNQDGYSKSQWDDYLSLARTAAHNFLNPPEGTAPGLYGNHLGIANSLLTYRTLRRNYLCLRYSIPDLWQRFDSQCSILVNIDDGSSVLQLTTDYELSTHLIVALGADWYQGDSESEFGLTPWGTALRLSVKYLF